nr:hypothetical protein GCM10020092_069240 [Actinoplanes digitatis]
MTVTTDLRLVELPPIAIPSAGPAVFRSSCTPVRRTLIDILDETVRAHPGAAALDDGVTVLTYRELADRVEAVAASLAGHGIGAGDRVGVRISSGTAELYLAILGVLAAGAAYVPVDADDPEERAELVFAEAGVCAVLGDGLAVSPRRAPGGRTGRPGPADDAWIIFTSGSTGTPKGVAVSHGSAAAFVDAEARLFLADGAVDPIGPRDRALAGLSVAFDASCEEMWLAWRHGACLVPAERSLVRSGVDLGPWLAGQRISVVSTVPTLAALWPVEALDDVRLLIFGGEACPPELAERLAVPGREVWNTYGPTEATVVACAARMTGDGPVRIGLPLAGWQLAVVDAAGEPVSMGETGELVIGGVGLARYLDADKDAEKFAALPALGWRRAYRSGDIVRAEPDGLLFVGRGDEQVKLGGRRIELGEVDAALQALPGVAGAAAAVRRTAAGNQLLVGYVVPGEGAEFDAAAAALRIREQLPAALVPLLAVVDALPTRTSGKVDRAALPWPLATGQDVAVELTATEDWLAGGWEEILGVRPAEADADFFSSGGGSLTAAQLVAWIRSGDPRVSVADIYLHPSLSRLAAVLDGLDTTAAVRREVRPTPRRAGLAQGVLLLPMLALVGLRWLTVLAALGNVLALVVPAPWALTVSWWWVALGWALLFSPLGRIGLSAERCAAAAARRAPGQLPARRRRAPAAVGRGAARRGDRGDRGRRRLLDDRLRPGARRRGRPGRRPALRAAGHGPAQARPRRCDRAGGRPVRPLGRRRRRARRPGTRRPGRPGRFPQHPPARRPGRQGRADRRRLDPGSAPCRRTSAGPARPRRPAPRPRPGGPRSVRRGRGCVPGSGPPRTGRPRSSSGCCRWWPPCRRSPWSAGRWPSGRRPARWWPPSPRRPSPTSSATRCWCSSPSGRSASACAPDSTRFGAGWRGRSGRPSGSWAWPGSGCSRSTPACSRRCGCGCWAPRWVAASRRRRCSRSRR